MKRDPKGLYKKDKEGKISDLTGLQDVYEAPDSPDISVDTEIQTPEQTVEALLNKLVEVGHIIRR